jgi:hypothetical protein
MASPSRTLKLTYLGDASQLQKTNKDLDGDYKTLGDRFKKFGVNAAKAFAAAGAAAGAMAVKFGKDAVKSASDLNESINALEVVFGDASQEMLKLSDAAARAVGLSKNEFNSLSVSFSAFTKRLATDNKDVVAVTDELTKRIADFASVMNLEVSEAAQVFQSTLAGSSEVARRFGIDTSAAAVTQYALEAGLIASKNEMDENIRVQATYGLIMQETDQLTGDFANTSDQLANSQRILKAEFENVKAEAGQQLLPVMQTLVGFVRDFGLPAFTDFIDRINSLIESVQEFWQRNGPQLIDSFNRVKEAGLGVRDAVKEITDNFKGLFGEIDENTKEGSGIFTFQNWLEGITLIIEALGALIQRLLSPFQQFADLLNRITNSRTVQVLQALADTVKNTLGFAAGSASTPSASSGPLQGLQGPPRFTPLLPPVQGPNRAGTNITIQGAIDPEGTARQIRRILEDSTRRVGAPQSAVFAP